MLGDDARGRWLVPFLRAIGQFVMTTQDELTFGCADAGGQSHGQAAAAFGTPIRCCAM